jgi:gluconokinase
MAQLFSPRANVYSRVILLGIIILVCGAGWATSTIYWSPYTTYVGVLFDPTGAEDPTHFDARCTRFLGVNYDELVERTRRGESNEETLEWCFARGRRPNDEEISIWNAFLRKRGWRDEVSEELAESKKEADFGDREDIQTWIDLHDTEEGRTPRALFSR